LEANIKQEAIEVGRSQVIEFMSLFLERIGCRVYTFHRQDLGSRFAIWQRTSGACNNAI